MTKQAFEHSLIVGVLQVLATCCFHCPHNPSPRTGDQPYWGLEASGQLRGQLSRPVSEGGWAHSLSPALPALAAHQMWQSWAGADLAGRIGQPGGTGHTGGPPGAGAGSAWHINWRILGLDQAWWERAPSQHVSVAGWMRT